MARVLFVAASALALLQEAHALSPARFDLYAIARTYSFGALDLSSNTSARNFNEVKHWSEKDLPGMGYAYCSPQMAGDDKGTMYAFAGSSCGGHHEGPYPGRFALGKVLTYNFLTNETAVHGDIPQIQWRNVSNGPSFSKPFYHSKSQKFYVVARNDLVEYDALHISSLLEFDTRTGKTSLIKQFGDSQSVVGSLLDTQSGLLYMNVDEQYDSPHHKAAVFDINTNDFKWLPNGTGTLDFAHFAGYDSANKIVVLKDFGGKERTNYHFGHLECSGAACTFIDNGELEGLWSNQINKKRQPSIMDGIEGITFDPLTRQLSVQTNGCYHINNQTAKCIDMWDTCTCRTTKFTQWQLPDDRKGVVLKPSYYYVQVGDMDFSMKWSGLALVGKGSSSVVKPVLV